MAETERPITIKEMNEIQLQMMREMFTTTQAISRDLGDFRVEVSERLAVLEATHKVNQEVSQQTISKRSLYWMVTGIILATLTSVFATFGPHLVALLPYLP